ncbi:MAG: PorT family protein [Bacteroidetes bacterium]|nr:PorT family protein [Bacteroidota bacterium]
MRKLTCVTILCCMAILATAADTQGKGTTNKKLFIGFNFAPGVGFRTLHLLDGSNGRAEAYALYQKNDKPIFGYNLGVDVTYKFTRTIGLQTGASYSMKGLLYSAASTFSAQPTTYSTLYRFHFIDVPLLAKFYAAKGSLKFIGGAGLVLNFLFGQQDISETVQGGQTTYHTSHTWLPAPKGPNIFTMSALASAGVDYRINARIGIRAEPYFSHGFLPFVRYGIKTYL